MFTTDTGDQSDELLAQEMERQEREALQQRQDDLFEKMSQVRFIALFFKNLCPIPAQGQDKGHKVKIKVTRSSLQVQITILSWQLDVCLCYIFMRSIIANVMVANLTTQ